jgi:lysyl-tRNA synthetase class 2
MRPEVQGPTLTEEEEVVLKLLKQKSPITLSELKEKAGLSNKKWDKAIKGLSAYDLAKVSKNDEGLFVNLMS